MLKKLYTLITLILLALPFQAQAVNLPKDLNSVVIINSSNKDIFEKNIPATEKVEVALGAGFFISKNLIITANHVVKGFKYVEVYTHDGRKSRATKVAVEESADVAILKVDLDGVPLKIRSTPLGLGEDVWAIGHPKEHVYSVSKGIVSNPSVLSTNFTNAPLVQIDAAINEGNSGGPLVDDNDEVIGIADFIDTASGGSNGLGFAIRSDFLAKVAASAEKYGKVKRVVFGIAFDVKKDKILVENIKQGGLGSFYFKKDDQILSIGGLELKNGFDVLNSTILPNPDAPLIVKVKRGETILTFSIPANRIGTR